jgi:hypothetical protein
MGRLHSPHVERRGVLGHLDGVVDEHEHRLRIEMTSD